MDTIKKRGSGRSFMCFRPVAIEDGSAKPDGSGNSVLTFLGVQDRESTMVIPKILTSLSNGDAVTGDHPGKATSRRSFSRILKAVLFETSLAKKVRKRRARKKTQTDQARKGIKNPNTVNEEEFDVNNDRPIKINSSPPPSRYSSSSCVSSISSNSRSSLLLNSIESRQKLTTRVGEFYHSNIALCLLLFSLLVLIFWGRVFAIFCTSTWLFVAPSRRTRVDSPEKGVDSPEHKKRVIMEGLLERNRSRPRSIVYLE